MKRPTNDDLWLIELKIGIYALIVFLIFVYLFSTINIEHP